MNERCGIGTRANGGSGGKGNNGDGLGTLR